MADTAASAQDTGNSGGSSSQLGNDSNKHQKIDRESKGKMKERTKYECPCSCECYREVSKAYEKCFDCERGRHER